MIEELYFRDLVDFKSVKLEFSNGLVVFSGPSGAGKSLLMSSILGSFGYQSSVMPELCELKLDTPINFSNELYEVDENIIIKSIKKEKIRYYLNDQNISKKSLEQIFSPFVQYLSVRDKKGIGSDTLIEVIDKYISSIDAKYDSLMLQIKSGFDEYRDAINKLEKIKSDELKIADIIEFTRFEIEKISSINPKIDEDIYLLEVKQKLSRLDKIKASVRNCDGIFDFESRVCEFYRQIDKDSSMFEESMNQLRIDTEETSSLANELEEMDIENILSRLEDISYLQNRYGSIAASLEQLERKKDELKSFEFIEEDKSSLESYIQSQLIFLDNIANTISQKRKNIVIKLEASLNSYLFELRLPNAKFVFEHTTIHQKGCDSIDILLGNSTVQTLSGGEFNRLRLALLAASTKNIVSNQGVIILDEIDANVSGDESIAIANMLDELSKSYQIFAISHQPHLSAKANQHILVSKNEYSSAVVLDKEGRVMELARIMSGENQTKEALEFAKTLLI